MTDRQRALALALLAALSGGATLAGEVLGARLLRLLLGSTGIAQAGTVAGVLGGLGLGAWWTGRALARASLSPRRALVGSHLALALFALASPTLSVALAPTLARAIVSSADAHPSLGELLRVLLGLAVTLAPGALAGVVYPSAVALLRRGAGRGTAWVGAASSVGAAVMALAATFVLAPRWGVAWTLRLAGGLYALVALLAWRLPGERPEGTTQPIEITKKSSIKTEPSGGLGPWGILVPIGLVGVASTLWQGLMSRLGALSFGPSAYALAVALSAHVTALAAGELLAGARVERAREPARALGKILLVGAVSVVLVLPFAMELPGAGAWRFRSGAPSLPVLWGTVFALVTALTLPAVGCIGAAMAFGARALAREGGLEDGDANGRLLVAMSAGNVLGALAGPLAVVPVTRVEGALALTAGLLALAGLWLARPSKPVALVGVAALALLSWRGVRRVDAEALLSGPYLYGGTSEVELGRVVWRRDGREGSVAVRRDETGNVLLQINGKVDATSEGDAVTQTVVGVLPVALARDPRDVLVIGLGSGMTADAARVVPGVRRVVVAEVVPEVVRAAREDFAVANHGVLRDPRVRVVDADAAHYLRGTSQTFDVIVSEPSNPWVAGMSDLFTREAFEAGRARLNPGGAMGAWFHVYSTDADTVAAITATFRAVFPRCALVEVSPGQDYLLVGFREPYALDVDAFLARVEAPAPRELLARAGLGQRSALIARFLAGSAGVEAIGRGFEPLRAADLTLEFRAPALLYRDAMADVFALFSRVQDLPFAGLSPRGRRYLSALEESEPLREGAVHTRNLVLAERAGQLDAALHEGEQAVTAAPDDVQLRTLVARLYLQRARARRRARDPGAAEADLTSVVELRPAAPEHLRALVSLGDLAARRGDPRRAYDRYVEALAITQRARQPAPDLHLRMARALATMGAREAAARELSLALSQSSTERERDAVERARE